MECTKNYDYNLQVFISFMRNYTDLSDESIARIIDTILETPNISSTLIVMYYRTIIEEAECVKKHDNVFYITSRFHDLMDKTNQKIN